MLNAAYVQVCSDLALGISHDTPHTSTHNLTLSFELKLTLEISAIARQSAYRTYVNSMWTLVSDEIALY